MTIREIRQSAGLSQRAFAERLKIPLQTYRPIDSGRRKASSQLLQRATELLEGHHRDLELKTLDALADEYDIHPRTLRAAARDGRLQVSLTTRSVFGRPLRLATRSSVDAFVRRHYRQRYSRFAPPLHTLPRTTVPTNFASRIIGLRLRLRITQAELARRIGAANKAVIYQWESRKRRPSIVFWTRIERLAICLLATDAGKFLP